MTSPYYQQQIDAALRTPIRRHGVFTQQFALFSTNLYQCLPSIPIGDHERIFAEACAHQALAIAEQRCTHQGRLLANEKPPPQLFNAPGIIATFHMGSYRLLGRWLAQHHIPFTLVLATDVYRHQGAIYKRIIQEDAPRDFRFGLLDAEHPLALRHMKRVLDAGQHLVVYLDGNMGAGGAKTIGRHGCNVPFLSSQLCVRTGVAALAAMMPCPIYPILNWRATAGANHFRSAKPIEVPSDRATRAKNVQNVMKNLYAWLGDAVITCPAQWESWFYLHHLLAPAPGLHQSGTDDDPNDWIAFCHKRDIYKLNRQSYHCLRVEATPNHR